MAGEANLKERVKRRLHLQNVWFWENMDAMGRSGLPDTSFVLFGIAGFIEWKDDDGSEPTKIQRLWLAKMAAAGGLSIVVTEDKSAPKPWRASYQLIAPNGAITITSWKIEEQRWLHKLAMNVRERNLMAGVLF